MKFRLPALALKFAPGAADNVLIGAISLDTAYQTARQRKDAAATATTATW
jgi:hypothetical protein